jgi:hypothetical protein
MAGLRALAAATAPRIVVRPGPIIVHASPVTVHTKAAAGWQGSLYMATRHFAGCYMVNVLELPSEDVAIALGHTDAGELVRRLYGHRGRDRALDRVTEAYRGLGVRPTRSRI